MRLIDAEPIEKFIEDGLNSKDLKKRFGNDAIEILTEIHYAPTIAPQPNNPLTLEELREMDGEPVYLDLGDGGEWVLVRVQQGKVFVTYKNTICAPESILFSCGGKAYRRKPEETNHD